MLPLLLVLSIVAVANAVSSSQVTGISYHPGAGISLTPGSSVAVCKQNCINLAYCAAWTVTSNGDCYLKHSVTNPQTVSGATSGVISGRTMSNSYGPSQNRINPPPIAVIDADEYSCVKACVDLAGCATWIWAASENKCYMRAAVMAPQASSSHSTGTINRAYSTWEPSTDRLGADLNGGVASTDAVSCMNSCNSNSDCLSWTHNSQQAKCYLKANVAPTSGASSVVTSGYRTSYNPGRPTFCIKAASQAQSGTTSSVLISGHYLLWDVPGYSSDYERRYECTITGGIPTGSERCCMGTRSGDSDQTNEAVMFISLRGQTNPNDGLKITWLYMSNMGLNFDQEMNNFDPATSSDAADCDFDAESCVAGNNCEQFWIDADDHYKCDKVGVVFHDATHAPFMDSREDVWCQHCN